MWNEDLKRMKAMVYGARGSLPNCSASTLKYGGNTTCLAVRAPDSPLIIIDAGTGIIDLGTTITEKYRGAREVHIFFTPSYRDDWTIHLYALDKGLGDLRRIFARMYQFRYFPVPFDILPSRMYFHNLKYDDEISLGRCRVRACRVNHPGLALGYRIESADESLFFASDSAVDRD